jgi:hypothetical protein
MRRFARSIALTLAVPLGLAAATPPAAADEPAAPRLEFAFEETVTLGAAVMVGKTAYGERFIILITGGTFEGPGLKGVIVPGSWDWQLRRADGCTDVKADYLIRTDDGVTINVLNRGAACGPDKEGKMRPVRTSPVFEAPLGKYEWLGQTAFVGTLDPVFEGDKVVAVRIRFYRAL